MRKKTSENAPAPKFADAPAAAGHPAAGASSGGTSAFKKYGVWAAAALAGYLFLPVSLLQRIGIHKAVKFDSFTATDLQGRKTRLSECEGRPILVYVWTTDSPRAIENLPLMNTLYYDYRDSPVCFLPVTLDPDFQGTVAQFVGGHGIEYPVYNGYGYVTKQFWPPYLPMIYLIDRSGYIRQEFSPTRDDQSKIAGHLHDYIHDGSPESRIADLADPEPDLDDGTDGWNYVRHQASDLLAQQRYDELDRIANDLRTTKARFKDGLWKLDAFYDGLTALDDPRSTNDDWRRRLAAIQSWRDARATSVTAGVALGDALISYAWYTRGSAYASSTSEEDMTLFERSLERARQILEETERLPTKCPRIYADLQSIDLADGTDPAASEALFNKAVDFEPDYYSYYTHRALYLMPKWHGEPGQWEDFAETAALHSRAGLQIYARIVVTMMKTLNMAGHWDGAALFRTTTITWPLLRQSFLDIDKRYPDSRDNLNKLAWFACQAGDKETAKETFARLGGNFDKQLWRSRIRYERWKNWSATTTLWDRIAELKSLISRRKV